ncbi:MAG: efflux RND transporter periplasmic adaptor subunit [Sphingomonas sp.]|nr:MAG: efflux RND transporter periplasmic adaptor subunit [Sphingomonas sp.]
MRSFARSALPLSLVALLATGCSGSQTPEEPAAREAPAEEEGHVALTPAQIAAAGITLVTPLKSGGGSLTLPATIEGDPERTQLVSAAMGGRVVSLTRNLGQPVRQGETLAVLESSEAASLNAEVEAAGARLALADSNLRREQKLFAERVTPEQDLIAARTAAEEARIAVRLARQKLSATGGSAGALNRVAIRAPISGHVIARAAALGETVAPDAELFRVADLSQLSVTMALTLADAGQVRPGASVEVSSADRRALARVSYVSPVLDTGTRLVTVIARLDNRAGDWRVGEPVTAAIQLEGAGGTPAILVPAAAVQTVEGRPSLFVRTDDGFRAVPVTLGQPSGDRVVITSGLSGDERIAVANSFTLKAELGKGEAEHGGH